MNTSHPTHAAAVVHLVAAGFTQGESYWIARGPVDPFFGSHDAIALCTIERREVAQQYGGGEFFEITHH